MPSKSSKKTELKSPKSSKSKVAKSSEYIDDSDDDVSMNDAASLTRETPLKSSEKTSKKRNRDGSEKVNNGVPATKTKSVASTRQKSGKSAREREELVETASDSDSNSSSASVEITSPDSSSKSNSNAPGDTDSSNSESESASGSGSEESEEEQVTRKGEKPSFKLPQGLDVPAGFKALEITPEDAIPSNLAGKQLFLFSAPAKFDFSHVKKLRLHGGADGETIEIGDVAFNVKRAKDAASQSLKVLMPREGKKGYQLASTTPSATYGITEAPPSGRTRTNEAVVAAPGPRPQPEGLRMRFMPAGYGSESDIHIKKSVLPRMDLASQSAHDQDIEMNDVPPLTPKKSKSKEATSPEKGKKKTKIVENAAVGGESETMGEKKSKKDPNKSKSKDTGSTKEKKKHKKDKTTDA